MLNPGAAAPPHVLLPDGAVQRDRGVGGAVERSADAWLGHDPAGSVRPVRPAGAVEAPTAAYEYADWRRCRVGLDYHIEVDRGFYSVPHQLLRQEVEVRLTVDTVEVFRRGKRVASHVRGAARHRAEHGDRARSKCASARPRLDVWPDPVRSS